MNRKQWLEVALRQFEYVRQLEHDVELLAVRMESATTFLMDVDKKVSAIRDLLPAEKRTTKTMTILDAFADAVKDIGTLLSAIIDYRNLLIRADLPDNVSGRHGGVEAIFAKYGIVIDKRKTATGNYFSAFNPIKKPCTKGESYDCFVDPCPSCPNKR